MPIPTHLTVQNDFCACLASRRQHILAIDLILYRFGSALSHVQVVVHRFLILLFGVSPLPLSLSVLMMLSTAKAVRSL